MTIDAADVPGSSLRPWPSAAYAWWVVAVLVLAHVLFYVDRTIMSIVIEPVKHDLGLTDTQVSLLIGFSFAAFYVIAGMPLGWMADRFNRVRLLAAGIGFWSLMTALCGFSGSFSALFLARMGVGIGEAVLLPAALSVIADYFAPARRHLPITVFATAGMVGVSVGYLAGAAALVSGTHLADTGASFFGMHTNWQWAFLLVAAPGALIVLLVLAVREPVRRGVMAPDARVAGGASRSLSGPLAQFSREHWRTFVCFFAGASLMLLVNSGYALWGVSMFVRVHGWTPSQAAAYFAPVLLAVGIGGSFIGPWFSRLLAKRGHTDAVMRASVYLGAVALVLVVGGTLLPNPYWVLAVAFSGTGLIAGIHTLNLIAIQLTVPNQMRGRFSIFYSICLTLVGGVLGPTLIALLSDYVYRDENQLHYAIATSAALAMPVAIFLYARGLKHFRRTAAAASVWMDS